MSRTVPGYKQAFVKYLVSGFGRDTCLLFNTRYILCERQMKLSTRNYDRGVRSNFQKYEAFNFTTIDQFHKKLHIFAYQSMQCQTAIRLFMCNWFQYLPSHLSVY